jgi:hypothetical protein
MTCHHLLQAALCHPQHGGDGPHLSMQAYQALAAACAASGEQHALQPYHAAAACAALMTQQSSADRQGSEQPCYAI